MPDEVVLDQDLQQEVMGALISNVELMLAFDVQDELHSRHPTQQARHPRLSFTIAEYEIRVLLWRRLRLLRALSNYWLFCRLRKHRFLPRERGL